MRARTVMGRSLALLVCAVVLFSACMDDDGDDTDDIDDVAEQVEGDVIGSPTAAAGLEEDIEEITVEIADGEFGEDAIELIEGRPTVLRIQNNDDVAYTLRIDPLVNGSAIPADTSVAIEFTTPSADTFTGELLPESGDEPLDTMTVQVINPAGEP